MIFTANDYLYFVLKVWISKLGSKAKIGTLCKALREAEQVLAAGKFWFNITLILTNFNRDFRTF